MSKVGRPPLEDREELRRPYSVRMTTYERDILNVAVDTLRRLHPKSKITFGEWARNALIDEAFRVVETPE